MSKLILVAYASGTGSTAEVATAIADVLKGEDETVTVDVKPVKEVTDIDPYGAVVIGSSIRAGRWLPQAEELVENIKAALAARPFAYFTTCLTMVKDTADSRRIVKAYMEPVLALTPHQRPIGLGLFAGSLDPDRRLIMPSDAGPQGDYRDWEAIRGWAKKIRPLLLDAAVEESDEHKVTNLRGAILSFTDMSGNDLSEVDLRAAELESANLKAADFEEAFLNWANLTESKMQNANLKGANLIGSMLQDANLNGADLQNAILNGADLSGADLQNANLQGADLNWTDFSGANLQGANLQGATMAWANFTGAALGGIHLTDATCNEHTRWPEGFDPTAFGCKSMGQLTI